ncbi:DNA-binding transcriptional MocR family regulator [Mycolicibacterium iranicum]|uniref:DNA-binding transcriptional MocR family regulator n=1 Tax=Mycolicibacterium iranicum TaxID=912594 RepID=A0A839QFB1_MYCIR|nr:PLP-dependent aminotransferase family protein [Mycolicibacterium iranicum]MBB2991111.1 DNA-binding transcriptional MocR family regulator [Mycolicibacterium iranicum]
MRIPRYSEVADDIAGRIRAGVLPAGTRLPTHRALATEHGIAVATATKVYRALTEAGMVVGEAGRGTYVRDVSGYAGLEMRRHTPVERVADLSFNQPLSPDQGDQLRRTLRELAAEGDLSALLMQEPPGGRTRGQAAVATYLLGHGIDVAPDNVVLTAGGQQGLDTVLGAVAAPGAVVAVDAVTYPGVKLVAAQRRLELAAVPSDTAGMALDHLERLCARRPVSVLYCTPTLHNPLGFVLGDEDRRRLAALARRHDVLIVEDAVYAFLEPGHTPLQALAPERTFYVGSVSKSMAPGIRFGYVVAPTRLRDTLIRSLRASSWGTSTLAVALATRWLTDGTAERLESSRREDAGERQRLATTELAGLQYHAHPASYLGWLTLPDEARHDVIARDLAEAGILVTTADAFATTKRIPNALRLALATPERADLILALREIASRIRQHMPAARPS